jgi:hypothetical protein
MKNKIIKRTYSILNSEPSTRVEYAAMPKQINGTEIFTTDILKAHLFDDDSLFAYTFPSQPVSGNDRSGDYLYIQEVITIAILYEERKIGKWDAKIIFDEAQKQYTITYAGEGGAIVSDKDISECEKKFIKAMGLSEVVKQILIRKKVETQEVLDKYFKDGKSLYFQSSDALRNIEGDTYLRYQKTGKIELYFGGNNGEVCLLCTTDVEKLESLIKAIIYG